MVIDPLDQTFWLNLTNVGLGVALLACWLALLRGIVLDLLERAAPQK